MQGYIYKNVFLSSIGLLECFSQSHRNKRVIFLFKLAIFLCETSCNLRLLRKKTFKFHIPNLFNIKYVLKSNADPSLY